MTSGGGRHEIFERASDGVSGDDHDGVLSKTLCDPACQTLCTVENYPAAAPRGVFVNLDHHTVLASTLPCTPGTKLGHVRKGSVKVTLEVAAKRLAVEGDGKVLVTTLLESRRKSRANVDAYGAHGREISSRRGESSLLTERSDVKVSSSAHKKKVSHKLRGPEELEKRAGRWNGRFWLYFEFDKGDGSLVIETSWLPSIPEVTKVLRPLGFQRAKSGAYRLRIPKEKVDDHLGIVRLATRAIDVLMKEGYV